MWGNIIEILIALPISALLLLLVPRRAARAWAVWLLIGLIATSVGGIGQGVFNYYNPDKLYLFTEDNELRFLRNEAGGLVGVVIDYPPKDYAASRIREQPVTVAGSSLLLAWAALLLLLRAEPAAPAAATAAKRPGRRIGISLQAFGLVVLLASMAQAIIYRQGESNLVGIGIIASGFYVSRGSRLAANWALALMALTSALLLFFLFSLAVSWENVGVPGTTRQPHEDAWAITIVVAITAWATVNLFLTARFCAQFDTCAEPAA